MGGLGLLARRWSQNCFTTWLYQGVYLQHVGDSVAPLSLQHLVLSNFKIAAHALSV